MALPPWTIEVLRRGLSDVARKASEPQTLEKIKSQASEILQEIPQTAARGIDAVLRSAEAGKRSVELWSRKHVELAIPLLNASGVLVHEFGTGVPMSAKVADVGRELISGDVVQGEAENLRIAKRIEKLLPSKDRSLLITANFPAAMAAFSLLVQRRQLVVHRSHAVQLPNGTPLPEAFQTLVPVIQEVGSVNRIDPHDFDGLDSFCTILADGGDAAPELVDLSKHDGQQAVVLPVATFETSDVPSIPSARQCLEAGADYVIMPGDGLAGGPDCGLLIGPTAELDWIRNSKAWSTFKANDSIAGMMVLALEQASKSPEELPIRALLATGEENLRGRAERLATRLSAVDAIQSCQVTAADARLTATGRWRLPSRQLQLQHKSLSSQQWAQQLREEIPSIESSFDDDQLALDLRWIAPGDDRKLAEALGGSEAIESEAE